MIGTQRNNFNNYKQNILCLSLAIALFHSLFDIYNDNIHKEISLLLPFPDDQDISHLQRNSDNVINNSSNKVNISQYLFLFSDLLAQHGQLFSNQIRINIEFMCCARQPNIIIIQMMIFLKRVFSMFVLIYGGINLFQIT